MTSDSDSLEVLGPRLVEQVDVVSTKGLPRVAEGGGGWVERTLLPGLAGQYREEGLMVEWAPGVTTWIHDVQRAHPSRILLTKVVEKRLGEALIPHLPAPGETVRLVVDADADGFTVAVPTPPDRE